MTTCRRFKCDQLNRKARIEEQTCEIGRMGTAQAMTVNFNRERVGLARMTGRKRLAHLGESIINPINKTFADATENRVLEEENAYNIMVPVCRAETTPASDSKAITNNFDAEVD